MMIALKNILVATDFSQPSDEALMYGRELARRFDATLHVLHVAQDICAGTLAESSAAISSELQQQIEADARRRLHELLVDGDKSGPRTIPVLLTSSSPASAIVDYAKTHDIDVVVMGTHGRGALTRVLMGSVAERVVRLATCPVLTVRHSEHDFVHPDTLVPAGPTT